VSKIAHPPVEAKDYQPERIDTIQTVAGQQEPPMNHKKNLYKWAWSSTSPLFGIDIWPELPVISRAQDKPKPGWMPCPSAGWGSEFLLTAPQVKFNIYVVIEILHHIELFWLILTGRCVFALPAYRVVVVR